MEKKCFASFHKFFHEITTFIEVTTGTSCGLGASASSMMMIRESSGLPKLLQKSCKATQI